MLIIIEGVDGSGKSTLAQKLVSTLQSRFPDDNVELWHAGVPSPNQSPLDLYERPLWNYVPDSNHHIVADRWHIGEWIYPKVLQRSTLADTATWRHIDMFLQAKGAVLVHATPPIKQVVMNIRRRGDDLVAVRQLQGIHTSYSAIMHASRLHKIRHVALGNPLIVPHTISAAALEEKLVAPLKSFVTYVGSPRPRHLLLGDVRHELRDNVHLSAEETRSYGPAFGPYRNTSGHYLLTHLPYDVMNVSGGLGIANACDVDDVEKLWETLGQPTTVTLGTRAAICVPWAKGKVRHPQYVKRFRHNSFAIYQQDILDAFGL